MPTRTGATADVPVALPHPVRAALGATSARALGGGGSAARLWLTERSAGTPVVVKETTVADGLVDGHDLDTFRRKPRQIRAVHDRLPALSPHYVEVVGEWHGPGWSAYAMPRHDGVPVTDLLPDAGAFFGRLEQVFGLLTRHGYVVDETPAPPDHDATVHRGRLRRRLPLLRRSLDPGLFDRDSVVVNGRSCRTLPALLAGDELLAALPPALLAFPVHGDLNLGNVLVRPDGGFTVLDPRGVLEPWDPVYDLAKSLLSLSVFERALAGGFTIDGDADTGYRVALSAPGPGFAAAAAGFLPFLDGLPYADRLDRLCPGWRRRLLVTHAVHCLAESACRLSDRKPRAYGDVRGPAACLLLARGLHLVGLRMLADVLDGAEAYPDWSTG